MYVYLVVFHGAELKNKCFNAWNCTVCPFSVGITTLEAFLGLKQRGDGMLDLEFFKKKFFSEKNFFLQNSFLSNVDYISTVFFIFGSYWGAGESWDFS